MHPQLHHAIGLAILASILYGCASGPTTRTDGPGGSAAETVDGVPVERLGPTETVPWSQEITADKRKAGMTLADLDRKMQAWNDIVLRGRESKDIRRVDLLEDSIKNDVRRHLAMIVDQLETGPVINRQIAAAALGFSDVPKTLGPLLAALQDPNESVVANALLGLSALRAPGTPVGGIAEKLGETSAPVAVRSNAGRALRAIDLSRLDESEREIVIDSARVALGDDESAVRVHGALILAEVVDADSIGRLSICLDDESPIVGQAASRALAHIGSVDAHAEGPATRAMAAAIRRVNHGEVRAAILRDLQLLSKRNYGDNADEWLEYANRLP